MLPLLKNNWLIWFHTLIKNNSKNITLKIKNLNCFKTFIFENLWKNYFLSHWNVGIYIYIYIDFGFLYHKRLSDDEGEMVVEDNIEESLWRIRYGCRINYDQWESNCMFDGLIYVGNITGSNILIAFLLCSCNVQTCFNC